jgi:hypothetical protein
MILWANRPLPGELSDFWSRRLDREHRLVYRIKGEDIEIIGCRYHYGNGEGVDVALWPPPLTLDLGNRTGRRSPATK